MLKIKKSRKTYLRLWIKKIIHFSLKKMPTLKEPTLEYLLKKYLWHCIVIVGLIGISIVSKVLHINSEKSTKNPPSLDSLVPQNSVLVPIEINNGKDIMNIIGEYGVVDLYTYSHHTGLPDQQVASVLKVLPPDTEDGLFTALIPEKEATLLFEYPDPFYAVVQNPNKKGSKIYKKKENKSLIVIEENF